MSGRADLDLGQRMDDSRSDKGPAQQCSPLPAEPLLFLSRRLPNDQHHAV